MTTVDATTAGESGDDSGTKTPDQSGGDERLSYQGLGTRLLSRPEFVGLLGALSIYAFFWTVSPKFGQAAGVQTVFDVAASPLGIMAVAVAALMIGGEFDLSSGAMFGAMAMLLIYFVRDTTGEFGGLGLTYWIAIPLSLAVALGIGWMNGSLVVRTGMPSFIVTLATFFVLRGLKLAYAKILVGQIQVGTAEEGKHFDFWDRIFASEWQRVNHLWEARDTAYTILTLVGTLIVLLSLFEFTFARAATNTMSGLVMMLVGIGALVGGVVIMHITDGNEWLPGIVLGIGGLLTAYGLGTWRYVRSDGAVASDGLPHGYLQAVGASVVLFGLALLFGTIIDAYSDEQVWHLLTEQGLRGILLVLLLLASAGALGRAVLLAGKHSNSLKGSTIGLGAVMFAALAFFVQWQSDTRQFRVEMFTLFMAMALVLLCWAVVSARFEVRNTLDHSADRVARVTAIIGILILAAGVATRLMFVIQEEIDRGDSGRLAKYSIRIVWFVGFTIVMSWVLRKTKFGSWIYAVGGNKEAARQVGVPADRVKKQLFMLVAFAAWLVGVLTAFRLNSVQAGTGNGLEFEFIIAAVVGGTLLSGGFGSALGAAMGAMIMAMATQGISFAGWNTDWKFVFLGLILLAAVYANQTVRKIAEGN